MPRRCLQIALLVALLQITTACAFGTTHIRVNHTPFEDEPAVKQGDLAVRSFRDLRAQDRRPFIGAKRNGYGMVVGHLAVPEGDRLEKILSQYFAEALQRAGYRAFLTDEGEPIPEGFQPIAFVDGDIVTFWLDLFVMTWHNVAIDFRLSDLSEQVLWEGHFLGDESNILWIGIDAEFEKVVRQALDEALDQAVTEFGSADFAAQVQIAAERARARTQGEEPEAVVDESAVGDDEVRDAAPTPLPTGGLDP